jgi:uncharacterized protein YpmB
MKNIIKIIFALAVILGSFFIGFYQAKEEYSGQLYELKEQLSTSQSKISMLEKSIDSINNLLMKYSIKCIDTVETNTEVILPKGKVNKLTSK